MSILRLEHVMTRLGPGPGTTEPCVAVRLTLNDAAAFGPAAARVTALCSDWFHAPTDATDVPAVRAAHFLARWAHDLINRQEGRIVVAGAEADGEGALILLGFHHPAASLQALALGGRLLDDIGSLNKETVDRALREFEKKILPAHPDYQAAILIEHARRNGIPWTRLQGPNRQWRFGSGKRGTTMFESMPLADSAIGLTWAKDKQTSKRIFEELGAPVARSRVVREEKDLTKAAEAVGYPCVVKPLDRGRSVGVTTYVRDMARLQAAFRTASRETRAGVMVESHVEGELIRIIVLRGKTWRAIRRSRPSAVGDGKSSVRSLLEALNRERERTKKPGSLTTPVPEDEGLLMALREQGLRPEDVPEAGRRVRLRNIPLLAEGADYDDVTDALHPETRRMSEALADYFGIRSCGLDFLTEDPSRSCHELGAFLEINATPGLRVPLVAGVSPDELGRAVLGEQVGRIPSLLIIADPALHEELRSRLPDEPGFGWASGALAGLGRMTLSGRRPLVHLSAETVTRHPSAAAIAVLATPDEIVRHGLPGDRFDLALLTEGTELAESWLETVRRHSGALRTGCGPEDVSVACREIGRA